MMNLPVLGTGIKRQLIGFQIQENNEFSNTKSWNFVWKQFEKYQPSEMVNRFQKPAIPSTLDPHKEQEWYVRWMKMRYQSISTHVDHINALWDFQARISA